MPIPGGGVQSWGTRAGHMLGRCATLSGVPGQSCEDLERKAPWHLSRMERTGPGSNPGAIQLLPEALWEQESNLSRAARVPRQQGNALASCHSRFMSWTTDDLDDLIGSGFEKFKGRDHSVCSSLPTAPLSLRFSCIPNALF